MCLIHRQYAICRSTRTIQVPLKIFQFWNQDFKFQILMSFSGRYRQENTVNPTKFYGRAIVDASAAISHTELSSLVLIEHFINTVKVMVREIPSSQGNSLCPTICTKDFTY